MSLAPLFAALAVVVLLARPRVGARRLAEMAPTVTGLRRAVARGGAAGCAVAGLGAAVLVGSPAGLVVGVLVAVAAHRAVARLEPKQVRADRRRLFGDLPLALDLLAACLAGGAAPAAAARAVGVAVGGPCGGRLGVVAAALDVGTAPPDAWALLSRGDDDDPMAPAARLLARAADGGAPVARTVAQLAADARAATRAQGEQAARRVAVLVVAPLGLCFLPAFVLIGVVPVVLGLAAPLLAG